MTRDRCRIMQDWRANAACLRHAAGMSLVDVLIALVIGLLITGGTIKGFETAARLSGRSIGKAEAVTYAIQTLEGKRNKIACRQGGETAMDAWFLPGSCAPDTAASPIGKPPITEPLPGGIVPSILGYAGTTRNYEVRSGPDFNGDGKPDYYIIKSKVTWNEPS